MSYEFSVSTIIFSFVGGFITGLNPCCYSAVPGALGYLGSFCRPSLRQSVWLSLCMGLGIFSANMILGSLVIFAGTLFGQILPGLRYFLASIPILMGLVVLGAIPLKLPKFRLNQSGLMPKHAIGGYLLGLVFSLAVLPCATPILASILSLGSLQGRMLAGITLLAAYGAGISIPIILTGTFFGFLSTISTISKVWPYISKLSGIILIVLGLYLFWKI